MSEKELTYIIESVVNALKNEDLTKKHRSYGDILKEGIFRFVIPGIIVFFATFFALQRSFEIFRINTENKFVLNSREHEELTEDIEDVEEKVEEQEKSFEELAKDYYSNTRGGKNKQDTNKND